MTEQETLIGGVVNGYDAFVLANRARQQKHIVFIAQNESHLNTLAALLPLIAPDVKLLVFPAWDTIPYDRTSPNPLIESERLDTLSQLANLHNNQTPFIILTCTAAIMQKIPPVNFFKGQILSFKTGDIVNLTELQNFLFQNGYTHTDQVMQAGEYALRGGIIDIFPTGTTEPYRLDLFGDVLDAIRSFNPIDQKTTGISQSFSLKPMSEFVLNEKTISNFRTKYRLLCEGNTTGDLLYEAVSNGRKINGIEHWLCLFFESMATLFDYLPQEISIYSDEDIKQSVLEREKQIKEYYDARIKALSATNIEGRYYPVKCEDFFLSADEFNKNIQSFKNYRFTSFVYPDGIDE